MKRVAYEMERGSAMKEDRLSELSMQFAVDIILLIKRLRAEKEFVISNQVGKSGTSIGANLREARYAQSKADFISKLQIALKEANETGFWLELLFRTDYISEEEYRLLDSMCKELRVKLIHSINTARTNLNQEKNS